MNITTTDNVFNINEYKDNLKNIGIDGLDLDHSSFPTISLKGNNFEMNSDPDFNLSSFDVRIFKTAPKFIITDANDKEFDGVKYSRDGITISHDLTVEDYMNQMVKDKRHPILKRYLDVMVKFEPREDVYSNILAVLSIPPTSRGFISGFILQLGEHIKNTIVTVRRGVARQARESGHRYFLWSMKVKI